nr:hypothetical protein [Bordetella bronchialis]
MNTRTAAVPPSQADPPAMRRREDAPATQADRPPSDDGLPFAISDAATSWPVFLFRIKR